MNLLHEFRLTSSLALALLVVAGLSLVGCDDDDTPAEEAAEAQTEDNLRDAGDSLQEAGEDIGAAVEAGAERAGSAVEEGRQDLGAAMEDAGEDLQDDDTPAAAPEPE